MIRTYIVGIIAGVIILLMLFPPIRPFFTVGEGEQAIVTQFGKFKRDIKAPGLHWKTPFIEDVTTYERRILASDAQPRPYFTLDKKRIVVDHVARWKITDPLKFFKTARTEERGRSLLDDIVFSELRQELGSRAFGDIIRTEREVAMEEVAKRSAKKAKNDYGITVVDVRLKRVDLPKEVQDSVFERMVAERQRKSQAYRSEGAEESAKIRAKTDKEKTIILAEAYRTSQKSRGEGDGEAAAIYASAYGQDPEFYGFVRSLEAYEKFLPTNSMAILSEDSRLFRHLSSSLNTLGESKEPTTKEPSSTSP